MNNNTEKVRMPIKASPEKNVSKETETFSQRSGSALLAILEAKFKGKTIVINNSKRD